ncbi:MAG: DNA helicase [Bacteroidetes bacterium]|nr:MAG: DNA helicase [Bacteroidota bacterium]
MNKAALADLFYRELEKIIDNDQLSAREKTSSLQQLLNIIIIEVTQTEKLQFTTLFTRYAYAANKYELSKQLQFFLHQFRKIDRNHTKASLLSESAIFQFGIKILVEVIESIFRKSPPLRIEEYLPESWPDVFKRPGVKAFKKKARVVILEEDEKNELLLGIDESQPDEVIKIRYNLPERNENFNPTIKSLRAFFEFPYILSLIDIEIESNGIYNPRAFVIEPDFLVDVSAVSECFSGKNSIPWLYLLKKYLPFRTTKYLMIGNIANFFLDELMNDPEITFKSLKTKLFALNPLGFCLFSDREVKEIVQSVQRHFITLKGMVSSGFNSEGIIGKNAYLEPSFYSDNYGLQGRLDIFHYNDDEGGKTAIVELKSGKAFMPNVHGISPNHFMQTLLYDLMVKDVFDEEISPANYILYSGQEVNQLKFAPASKHHQYDGLQMRNLIVSIEKMIASLGIDKEVPLLKQGARIFGRLNPVQFPQLKGFTRDDLSLFESVYQKLSDLEKKYFIAFSGFTAREHFMAKTGVQGVDRLNGQASLWRDDLREKLDNYAILSHLKLLHNAAGEEEAMLTFVKTEQTNPLANFRKGDIAVLYPEQPGQRPLASQLFKCTIVELSTDQVVLRLRAKQFNNSFFEQFEFWNIEHDLFDSSFTGMYRNLFEFAQCSAEKKALLLGQNPPGKQHLGVPETPDDPKMTAEQNAIFKKILLTQDYFLLWGPPGTGKTSVMLKKLVDHLFHNTSENILLLAYTNRAVDEICEAIDSINSAMEQNYFRIGSRFSTGEKWQNQLLNLKIENISSRQELKALIDRHRIVVGTISSVVGKTELFKLKKFDQVIIDEASQVPEPMLVGMLPVFKKFILIGDHRQLPAVVAQPEDASTVVDPDLHSIGLDNLRNSLFERLYLLCIKNGWSHAYAQLSHQGRMHKEIMAFPNKFFYEGSLKTLPESLEHAKIQTAPLSSPNLENKLESAIFGHRTVFIPTDIDGSSNINKTNQHEALLAAKIANCFKEKFETSGSLSAESIGIITPYRAQIALIKQALNDQGIQEGLITVDTVERYQGGARKVIIISLCVNELNQLHTLVSLSSEGVDRKLNVAMTRAKDHLILLGNEPILKNNRLYSEMIDHFFHPGQHNFIERR